MAKRVDAPNLEKVLAGLGITRQSVAQASGHSGAETAVSFGDNIRRNRQAAAPKGVTRADLRAATPSFQPPPGGGSAALPWKPTLGFAAGDHVDDGGGWMGFVGDAFSKVLNVVDTPRAYVASAVKEITDTVYSSRIGEWMDEVGGTSDAERQENLDRMGSGSWDDFVSQGRRHIGFREIWDSAHDSEGDDAWINRIVGVAGDLAVDPLSYIAFGSGSAVKAVDGVSDGIRMAIQDGGRNQISKAIAIEAAAKGVQGAGVDALIAGAAAKGRGALTKGAIARAGATDVAAELGVPRMARVLGSHGQGIAIPGTTLLTEGIESLKGAVKQTLGRQRAAVVLRSTRLAAEYGERQLVAIARGSGDVAMRAEAVQALVSVNRRTAAFAHFGAQAVREVKNSDWARQVRHMGDGEGANLLDQIETGAASGLASDVSGWLTGVRQKAVEQGLDIGWQDNYVPHLLTREARKLGQTDRKFQVWVESLLQQEGFQKARTVKGTIRELNAKSMAEHGVKVFEDDIETVVTSYITEVADAVGRQAQKDALKQMGVASLKETVTEVSSLSERPDLLARIESAQAVRDAARTREGRALDSAMAIRRDQIDTARQVVFAQRKNVAAKLKGLDRQIQVAGRRVATLDDAVARATARRDGQRLVLAETKKALSGARTSERRRLGRRLAQLEKDMVDHDRLVVDAEEALRRFHADFDFSQTAGVDGTNLLVDLGDMHGYSASVAAAQETRQLVADEYSQLVKFHTELKVANTPLGDLPGESKMLDASASLAARSAELDGMLDASDLAVHSFDVALADKQVLGPLYAGYQDRLTKFIDDTGSLPKVSKKRAAQLRQAQVLRDRSRLSLEMMETADTAVADLFARQNMLLDMVDIQAVEAGTDIADMNDLIKHLKDPQFREHTALKVSSGFIEMDDKFQLPGWMDDVIGFEPKVRTAGFWDDAVRFYDRTQNLWKGYAIARPGFIVRNAYSSLFNVYLEAGVGAAKSVKQFHAFYKIFKDHPDDYIRIATERFGDANVVRRLDEALQTVAATGGGLAHEEFQVGLLHSVSANPLSPNFLPIKLIRSGSEEVEALVRGGHAFDVLQRGGTQDLAIDTVSKWHFNYRDITEFDRAAKRVMPFWTFFSRDLALQASTFTRVLPKLNRTYFNVKRNLEYGEDPDTGVPSYDRLSLRLPGGDASSNVGYLPLDLPAVKFQETISNLGRPDSLVSQMTPGLKVPLELTAGRQFFTGRDFADKNSYYQDGVRVPREAPWYAQLPGVAQVAEATGITNRYADGTATMTDRTQYVLESLFPTLAQSRRATKDTYGVSSWLTGVGVRQNTPDMRSAADRRRQALLAAQQAERRDLGGV